MCLGKAALCSLDTQTAAAELQAAEQELNTSAQVWPSCPLHDLLPSGNKNLLQCWPRSTVSRKQQQTFAALLLI